MADLPLSSPRPWGCFLVRQRNRRQAVVFPTPVGVFLRDIAVSAISACLPHARGGVSSAWSYLTGGLLSSPRPWGCFSEGRPCRWCCQVFPTPVGVFPRHRIPALLPRRLPHARGGVSGSTTAQAGNTESSPRPWGCFRQQAHGLGRSGVFPTPVGVFPWLPAQPRGPCRLPHARGGVSLAFLALNKSSKSSPRPWGCF